MFNLAAIHDVNTGIILTTLTIAYLKNRHSTAGIAALVVFVISILPTPLHGTGVLGIAALLTSYFYFYRIWGKNKEISLLVLCAILLMMANIALGLKLRGIF
ncbi:MAG: hypothetical protein V1854_03175 [Methanobacteriota archaeon]